ncbi:MAG: hypothetical protein WDO68_05840 [Gammaproteobacteria bacterium]
MRNIAFSILLAAIAVLQIAVVSSELRDSGARVAAARSVESGARYVVASNETDRKASAL